MRSASLKIRSQLNGSPCWAVEAEVEAAGDSALEGARSGALAEWLGDFFSPFWLSGDLVMAGDVILEKTIYLVEKKAYYFNEGGAIYSKLSLRGL